MEELYLFTLILSLVMLLMKQVVVFGNWLYVNYFTDKTESYPLATFTIIASMSVGLFCILIIPIDVFMISVKDELISSLPVLRENLQILYFSKINI